ncbi:DAK2 domain-containing protein [Tessaracoccus defluvii]|uniref:DAK2 domain-containing protein n=1 Tax=Tessaracoccus defluvii TaxID=1285901 RepID=A0A7H0H4L1_9ACTN|nr:DAK2 domain-containing protein [Tessaracoccus defluvii]QNP55477.1 DAK2 domain-containing protein [Tessaracoccus defluvii]
MSNSGANLSQAIRACLHEFVKCADELGDLDQAIGDGDLGITASSGSAAVDKALAELPETATPSEVVLACAKAFANANPSTMAALVAGGLLAGSKTLRDVESVGMEHVGPFVKAAADSIGARGKSQVGDKTILDAMVPAADAFTSADDNPLEAAIAAAAAGVESSTGLQSRRGRASWLQERSIGLQDPGATGFLRFLEAWRTANA